MATPPFTIDWHESDQSPRETFDEDGFKATMEAICAWRDRVQLAKEFAGNVYQTFDRTVRTDPWTYPYGMSGQIVPGNPVPLGTPPVVMGVEVFPLEGGKLTASTSDDRLATYEKAKLLVTFRVPTWKKLLNPIAQAAGQTNYEYVSEQLEPSAEFLTMPGAKLWWDAAKTLPVSDEEAPGRIIRMMEWTRTRHRVIKLAPAIFDFAGCTNSKAVESERYGRSFASETLLYRPPRLEPVVMPDGTKCWDIVMTFSYRQEGWNKYWHAGETQPAEAGSPGAVWKPVPIFDNAGLQLRQYPLKDFEPLLWA